jgi:hypothetical protein
MKIAKDEYFSNIFDEIVALDPSLVVLLILR